MDDAEKQGWLERHMSQTAHCEDIRRQMSAYLEGTVPPDQLAAYEAHLAACRSCHGELSALREMLTDLRTLPQPQAPDLVAGIHRKLAHRQAAPTWQARLAGLWDSAMLRPVALAATAVLVVVVVANVPRT